jgi:hypothetical protein
MDDYAEAYAEIADEAWEKEFVDAGRGKARSCSRKR